MAQSQDGERAIGVIPDAVAEAERWIAWLRLASVPLIAASSRIPHPNPHDTAFFAATGGLLAYALGALVWVYLRPATRRFALAATALDIVWISVLAALSGGPFSATRLTYFLVPVAVGFRFRPLLTAAASAATIVAYLIQALLHPASSRADADTFIAVQVGYLAWLGLASVLLSAVLQRRTTRAGELTEIRRRLITDVLTAGERERRALAEGLHDHTIQNLLSARHDLEEAAERGSSSALVRADKALSETITELREAIFELHPYVLEQAGLEAGLRAIGQRAARRGGFRLALDFDYRVHHRHEDLVFAAAHEMLANAVEHASARSVVIHLRSGDDGLVLEIRDDGTGFDPTTLPARLAEGHIGLQMQRERIESVEGRLNIRAAPAAGTCVEIRLPA